MQKLTVELELIFGHFPETVSLFFSLVCKFDGLHLPLTYGTEVSALIGPLFVINIVASKEHDKLPVVIVIN
jgi:hypothetical protein